MSWWQTFLGFFLPNVLGYGGGPAMIPLLQVQVVKAYHWVSNAQFADALALANVLPGPIATKMAVYVGYQVSGWLGMVLALVATVVPSALALIALLRLLNRYRTADPVRGMTLLVQPVIAVLMVGLTWEFGADAVHHLGWLQSLGIALLALWLMQRRRVHPAFVIAGAFVYGGLVVPWLGAW